MLPENRTFMVRGEDGQEYGPVDLAELREWVQENRAGLGTEVRRDEPGAEWNPWQTYPELVALLAVAQATGPAAAMVVAPMWKRVLAFVVDLLLLAIPTAIIFYTVVFLYYPDWFVHNVVAVNRFMQDIEAGNQHPFDAPEPPKSLYLTAELVRDCLFALYFTGFISTSGKTPGKAIFGLRVITEEGLKPNWGKSLLRALVMIVSISLLFIPLAYAFFNPQRRGLHDLLAGTCVIEE